MPIKFKNTEEFIKAAREIHRDKYDYSKSVFKTVSTPLIIICPEHGEFKQTPTKHLMGRGCRQCGITSRGIRHRVTQENFIRRAKELHGDKYDFSKTIYNRAHDPIIVTCPIHGDFNIWPINLMKGNGCYKCNHGAAADRLRLTKDEIIERCNKVHNNFYNYNIDNLEYKNNETKLSIICPIHGPFEQQVNNHLNGQGCPKCGQIRTTEKERFTTEQITEILKQKELSYDYSKVNYVNMQTYIDIICQEHGIFKVRPYNFIYGGSRCPKCVRSQRASRGEKELSKFIKENYNGDIQTNCRSIIYPRELDIFLPELNVGIEFNGIYWHKRHEVKEPGYHKNKAKLCKDKGIKLVNICDIEWTKRPDKCKEKILKIINER